MMGLASTVAEAAIGWLVGSMLEKLFTEKLQEWCRQVGLSSDVEELRSEMGNVQMVLAAAEGKEIKNKPLQQRLQDLKDLLYDAEDLMDELDYYRLQQHIEAGNATGDSADTSAATSSTSSSLQLQSSTSVSTAAAAGERTSASLSIFFPAIQLAVNAASSYVLAFKNRISRKRRREDEEPTHEPMVPLEIRNDMSRRIKEIVSQFQKFREDLREALGVVANLHSIAGGSKSEITTSNKRLTTSFSAEPNVYGRDTERGHIIGLLLSDKTGDLNVLPIVGNGGVGKTTLTRYVYHHQRVSSHFELQIWICVSNNFDIVRLTREMLEHICKDSHRGTESLNVLQKILVDRIKSKRFLLVLDDMWEDKDRRQGDELLAPLRCSQGKGSMILTTTRSSSVAKMVGTVDPIHLGGLDDEAFWSFFKACAFGDENNEKHPSLQDIGREIATRLRGNPLAAKSIGGLLRSDVSYEHWRKIQDEWKSLQGDNDIIPILKLSYDYLPFCLQRCFSYCSLFPEDYIFDGAVLVRIWISQGFVDCEHADKRLEEKGSEYFDDLVNLGFFQQVQEDEVEYYVMHDLMYDLARTVSRNECATIVASQSKEISPSTRHLSIITYSAFHTDENGKEILNEKFERELEKIRSLKKLRTLIFFGHCDTYLLRLCQTLCREACVTLRSLQIPPTDDGFNFLCNLVNPYHLRYLKVVSKYARRVYLPQTLSKFYHLQVLDCCSSNNCVVPSGMNNLVSLRHFIASRQVHSTIGTVGKMAFLQELEEFRVQKASGFGIEELEHMRRLVLLRICQLENVETNDEASKARLREKEHLEELCLAWDDSGLNSEPVTMAAAKVLEALEPHPNVKHLQISGYNGGTFPTWLSSDLSVMLLRSLHLENCSGCRTLPPLRLLPSLAKLVLIKIENVMEVSVPSLEELVLSKMPNLERCTSLSENQLASRLRKLTIRECCKLSMFPLSHLCSSEAEEEWPPSLRELTMQDCPHLLFSRALPPAPNMSMLCVMGVASLPKVTMNQSELRISSSSELRALDDKLLAFHNLRSLKALLITDCPNLVSFSFQGLGELVCLERLEIRYCRNLFSSHMISEEIYDDSANCLVLPSLKTLCIESCAVTGKGVSQLLSHLQYLEELTLPDCQQIIPLESDQNHHAVRGEESSSLPSPYGHPATAATSLALDDEELLQFPSNLHSSLKKLYLRNSQDHPVFCRSKEGLGGFTSLEKLTIKLWSGLLLSRVHDDEEDGRRCLLPPSLKVLEMTHLTDDLQHCLLQNLTSLTMLEISDSPNLTTLHLHSCTNLEQLDIWDCEHVAALEGLECLSCLRKLWISVSPGLSRTWALKWEEQVEGDERHLLPLSLERLGIWNLRDDLLLPRLISSLPSLSRLWIFGSPDLTSLQLASSCTTLEGLDIRSCESLSSVEGLQFLGNLRFLSVRNSPGFPAAWGRALQEQEAGGSELCSRLQHLKIDDPSILTVPFCKHLTSLQRLTFSNSERVGSLTEEQESALPLLTSPLELDFSGCPNLLSLPAELHSLPSLEKLEIADCPGISRLPEKGLPPSLELLEISGCKEELKQQCRMLVSNKLRVDCY